MRDLIIALCHVPGHPDIFWHKRNVIGHEIQIKAQKLLTSYLDIDDVVLLLSEVDESGLARGTIGQYIHAIIDIVHDRDLILKQISLDKHASEHVRYWSLILLSYYKQESELDAVGILRRYPMLFPDDDHIRIIEDIIDSIRLFGGFTLY